MNMKKLFASVLIVVASWAVAYAVPAYPGLVTYTQPDGSEVECYLVGDEYSHYMTSEDGYLVAQAANGEVQYARLSSNMKIEPVGVKASSVRVRSVAEIEYLRSAQKVEQIDEVLNARYNMQRSASPKMSTPCKAPNAVSSVKKKFPLQGSPKSLVILVNFTDIKFRSPSTANQDFTDLLNQKGYSYGGSYGSAKDYFEESSFGQFSPEFVVKGPVDLPHDCSYYGSADDANADQMVSDACRILDDEIDFREYDTNGDGRVDNIFIYYAGYNESEGGPKYTVWPHQWVVQEDVILDGVMLWDYACTSELKGNYGSTRCGIGTFCHEFGHVLSLPDLYDTNNNRDNLTLGSWDIMDRGSYNNYGRIPPSYSSYERFYLGWLEPEILSEEMNYSLTPLLSSNKAYIVTSSKKHNLSGSNPNPNEFWMVENRRKEGMDVFGLPDGAEGILVTHIVYNQRAWDGNYVNNNINNLGVEIVCAMSETFDPIFNVYPGEGGVRRCDFKLRSGGTLSTPLLNISETADGVSSFFFGADPAAAAINLVGSPLHDFDVIWGVEEYDSQVIELVGRNLTNDVTISLDGGDVSQYAFRVYSEEQEGDLVNELTVALDANGGFRVKVEILFTPTALMDYVAIEDILKVVSDDVMRDIALRGYSRKDQTVDVDNVKVAAGQMLIVRNGGKYAVLLPEVNGVERNICVYSASGVLVATLPAISQEVTLPRLVDGQLYVVVCTESGSRYVGKMIYRE